MNMAEKLNVTFEEFMQMPKEENKSYELSEIAKSFIRPELEISVAGILGE